MTTRKILKRIREFVKKNWKLLTLILLFVAHIFTRFYLLEYRLNFDWDQVDNAWAAKSILIDHNFPLLGMVAKQNSGFNIGPLYYYLISVFYWIFNLNPIASGVFAGVTSIFTFFVIFFVMRKLFSYKIALIALFIHTISYFIIVGNRSQWPVNFIVPISFLIFYFLYKVLMGELKYLILLSVVVGFSFHIHFTSVFYPIIILQTLPFFPRKKEAVKYIFLSVIVFLLFLLPNIISEINSNNTHTNSMFAYIDTYYHGFHLRRVLQLINDAFVEFQLILRGWTMDLNYFFPLIFFGLYLFPKPSKEKLVMCYLIALWFIVPWFVFSTYKGEISNYYFFSTRPLVILILSYLTYRLLIVRNYFVKVAVVVFWLYFSYVNISQFFNSGNGDFIENREKVEKAIDRGEVIEPYQNFPQSYLYYYYYSRIK